MSTFEKSNLVAAARRQWVSPVVKLLGTIAEVLKAGGGKLSVAVLDMGDPPRKPKGQIG